MRIVANVLWISLDSAALSLWGCYGNLQGWTPQLDRLAARGVVFDEHYVIQDSATELAQALKLQQEVLGRGGIVETISPDTIGSVSRNDVDTWNSLGDRLVPAFQECTQASHPVLIQCQLPPLTGDPPDLDEEDEDDEEVSLPRGIPFELLSEEERMGIIQDLVFVDEWLAEMIEEWEEAVSDKNSWLIVTARRGSTIPFVESRDHVAQVELLSHVPLIVCSAAELLEGERVRELTSDLQLNEALSKFLEGTEAGEQAWQDFLQCQERAATGVLLKQEPSGVTLRTPEAILVAGDPPQVYHMPEDRWGLQDVSHSEQELTEKLQAELAEKLTKNPPGT